MDRGQEGIWDDTQVSVVREVLQLGRDGGVWVLPSWRCLGHLQVEAWLTGLCQGLGGRCRGRVERGMEEEG